MQLMTNFDALLEDINPLGPYQIWTFVLLGLALFPVAANHLANVFLAGLPTFSCSNGLYFQVSAQKVSAQKVSAQKVSGHKVTKIDNIGQKVSIQKGASIYNLCQK